MTTQAQKFYHLGVSQKDRTQCWKRYLALWGGGVLALSLIISGSLVTTKVLAGSDQSRHESDQGATQKHSHGKSMEGAHSHGDGKHGTHNYHAEKSHHNHFMKTVKHDGGGNGIQYDLTFKAGELLAAKPIKLSFKPIRGSNPDARVPLAVVHEKKIHLLIVSKDLSYFAHEHPVEQQDGYYVWNHTFPKGGKYVLFADYTPIGGHNKVKRIDIIITPYHPHDVEHLAGAAVKNQDLTWEENGYRVSLATQNGSGSFNANTPVVLRATVTKNGKAVTDLSPFLGALAHMVLISKDTKEFLHVHPLEGVGLGPDILLATNFTNPGLYKIWIGFNHKNKIQTSAFVVKAK